MGQDALDKFADQFTIFSQLKNQAKSQAANFPSTTATSLSTLGTGALAEEYMECLGTQFACQEVITDY
jgi:hypothetical protein